MNIPARGHQALPPTENELVSNGHWDITALVADLRAARLQWRQSHHQPDLATSRRLPSVDAITQIVSGLKEGLFPLRLGATSINESNEDFFVGHTINVALTSLAEQIELELSGQPSAGDPATCRQEARDIVRDFAATLPATRSLLDTDVEAAFFGDPAARSFDEVLLCYPGITAIIHHRLAHRMAVSARNGSGNQ